MADLLYDYPTRVVVGVGECSTEPQKTPWEAVIEFYYAQRRFDTAPREAHTPLYARIWRIIMDI